jgi:adenine-specific DNA-methyltransferase
MTSNKTPEQDYIATITKEHQDRFSQFFTPEDTALDMQRWIWCGLEAEGDRILDPAWGLGILTRWSGSAKKIYGFEKDPYIFSKNKKNKNLKNADYLTSKWKKNFYGAVISNPPYLKGIDIEENYTEIFKKELGVKLSGKTNLYCYFLLKGITECKGRYAFLVPSDFLDSNYGVAVKKWLLETKSMDAIVLFEENIFPGVFTKSCIIYGNKSTTSDTLEFKVCGPDEYMDKVYTYNQEALDPKEKWNRYYEPQNVVEASHTFGEFANVTRGVNTGDNTYFVLNKSQLLKKPADFKENTKFCLLKPAFFNESIITDDDIDELFNSDLPCMMFSPKKPDYTPDQKDAVSMYIKAGKKKGVDKNFTCASRKEWWKVEHREIPTIVCGAVTTKLQFIYCEGNIIPLSGFNCIYPKRHTKEYGRFLHAYLLSSVAVKMFAGNKRNYGGKIKVMTAKDMMEAPCVDLWRLFKDRNKRKHVMAAYNLFYTADRRILLEERIADYRRLVDDVFREFL